MAEKEHPVLADPFMEFNLSGRGVGRKIRGDIANMKANGKGSFRGRVKIDVGWQAIASRLNGC
jgi:hypothetical protein